MLKFTAFGFPVQIHATFLILLLFLADSGLSATGLALFMAVILVSVVLHELGHAATVRRFHGRVEVIAIHALGGVTMWREFREPIRGWKRFLVAAAGSGVGLFAGLGLYLFVQVGGMGEAAKIVIRSPWNVALGVADAAGEYLIFAVGAFIWVSVVWGLVNWVPIGGLDGSRMLREVLIKVIGPSGDLHSRIIGLIVAIAAAVWLFQIGAQFGAVLVLFFAISDLVAYQRQRTVPPAGEGPGAGTDPNVDQQHEEIE